MARDIASVADKDTREDETRGEVTPVPDGPRSEGGPATRESRPDDEIPPAQAPIVPTDAPQATENPSGAVSSSDVGADSSPAVESAPVDARETADAEIWPSVIADALAEPVVARPTEAAHEAAADPGPLTPSPAPQSVGLPHDEAPASAVPAPPADPDVSDAYESSFTAAAEDLFRPAEAKDDPHLITLGRRLDPALRIPRPLPPDIAPRPEAAAGREPWWRTTPWKAHLRTAARYGAYAAGGYLALVLVLIVLFRFVNPPGSMLMLTQLLTGTAIDRTWVPLGSVSPNLVRAVIVSEDGRFCEHSGVDTTAIKEAIERAARGTPRGASTISMQVTKNLFLWNAKSYVRKVIEIPLTLFMELVWPKRRILEVYLNIAEWGPGVFGAEAAAQRHFNKSAARLSEREAALLAAVLPNPVVRDASSPGPRTSAKARVVQSRVKAYGAVASCVVSAAQPATAAGPAVVRPRTIRKAPLRPAQPRKKQKVDEWAPTLNFGPP